METRERELTYPADPNPVAVDAKDVLRKAVETKVNKLGAETNPAVWKNNVVEARDALET